MDLYELIFLKGLYNTILTLLFLVLITSFISNSKGLKSLSVLKTLLLIVFTSIFIIKFGFRDYSIGTDSKTYKYSFEYIYSYQSNFTPTKDFLWDFYNYSLAMLTDNPRYLFVLTALGYIALPIVGTFKYLKHNTIYFLSIFVISPNFFLYGANGIRNGLAASIFLLSLKYYKNYKQHVLILVAGLVHLSLMIPALFFYLSKYIKSLKAPLIIWAFLLLIALSGVNLLTFMPAIGRLDTYVNQELISVSITNKLVNFFAYSMSPIVLGIYVVIFRKIADQLYFRLLITYILCNCVYIMAFNSIYSVRFAYLSEFLMPFLLIYPLFRFNLWKYMEIKVSLILILIFLLKAYKIFIL